MPFQNNIFQNKFIFVFLFIIILNQMSENLTLSELNTQVKTTLQNKFNTSYRVVAEISEMNGSRGHVYLQLIEKDKNDRMLAKARATIWSNTYRMLKPYFETTTGHSLEAGLKVLVVVSVEFHEVYGFSLNIRDIDPTYTLGDIERKRLQIIRQLEEEGVIDMNKELEIPNVPQSIAVISSETAAGYGDFSDQLENNEFGYKFYTKLFPATVQGENAEHSIINALDLIFQKEDLFDLVVIIRGGGSKADLSCFDSYLLALNISQFSLPIVTGIGHERDESIADLVAHTSLKTPTAVAEFLIGKLNVFDNYITNLKNEFSAAVETLIHQKQSEIEHLAYNFRPLVMNVLQKKEKELVLSEQDLLNNTNNYLYNKHQYIKSLPEKLQFIYKNKAYKADQKIDILKRDVSNTINRFLIKQKHNLEIFEQKNSLLSPENIFKRGFSVNYKNGKLIKSIKDVEKGDVVETKLIDGSFESEVK